MNSDEINLKNIWKPVLIGLVLAFLYASVLTKLGKDWWTDENYSHGLLVPFVIGFIVWMEFDELRKLVVKPKFRLGGSLILLAILMLLGGSLGAELFTQRVSFVLILVGVVIYFFGTQILKMLIVPFVLLLLAIPIKSEAAETDSEFTADKQKTESENAENSKISASTFSLSPPML